MESSTKTISEFTMQELFPNTLTDTLCVDIDDKREVWVATEMCAQYLESAVDSILVRDNENRPLGIVGGYDLLDHIRKNPMRAFQYQAKVEQIAFKNVPQVEKDAKLKDLITKWKDTRRAFAVISESGNYYSISARKMLDVGIRSKTDMSVSSMPKKKIITFEADDTIGKIIDLMFNHKTRKLILKDSNQYVSDRLILGEISRILKFQKNIDNFLDVPASLLKLDYVKTIADDQSFNHLCFMMDKMDHPFVLYQDTTISPWDVCLALVSNDVSGPLSMEYLKKICPHCGKKID